MAPEGPAPWDLPKGPLFVYNGGLMRRPLRQMLAQAGWPLRLGLPRQGDLVGLWGASPTAWRAETIAARRAARLIRFEDAFLRSLHPGRGGGGAPLGLIPDHLGVHFDPARPSRLERILAEAPLDDGDLLRRAHDGMARLAALDLSKYNAHDPDLPPPPPGYVLVIDQLRGDASVRLAGVRAHIFREMLVFAQEEHPGARVLIKTHPETISGQRPGHYGPEDAQGRVSLLAAPHSPRALLEGAIAVYTVSSQMGLEAIFAGHRPRVFGQPFYAGWGLSADENPVPRRNRRLTRAQLFAASHILAPIWWDPCRGRLCRFEEAVDQLEAEVRAFRQDRHGHVATGMRAWKRAAIARHFGRHGPLRFIEPPAAAAETAARTGRPLLGWASRMPEGFSGLRVEDGFLRSRGLGADLVAPLSLVCDARGIYYDPTRPSDLETLIAAPLPAGGARRAEDLIARITDGGLTKYNLGGACPALPPGHRILVPGQVEDDASIRLGAPGWTNRALLERVRAENPDAVIVWKPHPDVVAGLRPGALDPGVADALADVSAPEADAAALIAACDEVWTLTSGLGFEALLRGTPVTCLGTPFYAGWGLTRDLGPQPARRRLTLDRRPDLARLVHAALIAYPRYIDPVSGRPCPPEVVIERLARGQVPPPGPANRALARLQGLLAPWAHLWR